MTLPGFNADAALGSAGRTYRGRYKYGHHATGNGGSSARVLPHQLEDLDVAAEMDEVELADDFDAADLEVADAYFENASLEAAATDGFDGDEVEVMDGADMEEIHDEAAETEFMDAVEGEYEDV